MKKVSMKSFILSATEETDTDYLRELPLLAKWGKSIDKKIDAPYRYQKKIAVETITNCKIPLPCDGVWVRWVVLGDHGCDCTNIFEYLDGCNLNYEDQLGYNDCQCFTWNDGCAVSCDVLWDIRGDCIEFPGLDNQTVTFEYLAYESDNEGFPIVYECHEDAIVEFIKYKLASRLLWKLKAAGQNPTALERERKEFKRDYRRGVGYAKAEHNRESVSRQAVTATQYNNPLSGRGMSMLESIY